MPESTWNDPRITSYVLDELTGDELKQFEEELDSNSDLADAVKEARAITGQLHNLYSNEETQPLEDERRESIIASSSLPSESTPNKFDQSASGELGSVEGIPTLDQVRPSKRNLRAPSWGVPFTVLAAAAVLLLLVGLAPWLSQYSTLTSVDSAADRSDDTPTSQGDIPASANPSSNESMVVEPKGSSNDGAPEPSAGQMPKRDVLGELESIDQNYSAKQKQDAGKRAGSESKSSDAGSPSPMKVESFSRSLPAVAMEEAADSAPGIILPDLMRSPGDPAEPLVRLNAESVKTKSMIGDAEAALAAQLGEGSGQFESSTEKPNSMDLARADSIASNSQPNSIRNRAGLRKAMQARKSVAMPSVLPPMPASRGRSKPTNPGESESAQKQQEIGTPGDEGIADRGSSASSGGVGGGFGGNPAMAAAAAADSIDGNKSVELEMADKLAVSEAITGKASRRVGRSITALGNEKSRVNGPTLEPLDRKELLPESGRWARKAGAPFDRVVESKFQRVTEQPISTFSVDVDTASYRNTRDSLLRIDAMPRPDSVRIEELVNYFDYGYQPPAADAEHPFTAQIAITTCPWNQGHRLARIAIQGKTMEKARRPRCNLVFLLNTSGTMDEPNKLPLFVDGMKMLTEQLTEKDRIAIAVYADSASLALDSVAANKSKPIRKALAELSSDGSTNGDGKDGVQGIALAYRVARENFIADGVNRVILCTDRGFDVETTSNDELVRIVEKEANSGIFLSVLGFGMGNQDESMLERISGHGDGSYAFVDSKAEAKKVFVDQANGTSLTIAKDVKLQLEFNPQQVSQYRLIGYGNRDLAGRDVNDVVAGEIGAGHSVTALYEVVPTGSTSDTAQPEADQLRYQRPSKLTAAAKSGEILTLKLRYTLPNENKSKRVVFPMKDDDQNFDQADDDVRFAAAVAGFGMKLRASKFSGTWTLSDVEEVASAAIGEDTYQLRAEFLEMVRKANKLRSAE